MGHNSEEFEEKVVGLINDYVESLKRSAEENEIRADLRDKAEELGLDKKALQDGVSRAKQSLKKREGYDESMAVIKDCVDKIGGAENLFSWVLEKEKRKEEEREAKRKERKAQKAKDDEYKAAPDRAPGEGKSIGEQQAEAIMAAGEEEAA